MLIPFASPISSPIYTCEWFLIVVCHMQWDEALFFLCSLIIITPCVKSSLLFTDGDWGTSCWSWSTGDDVANGCCLMLVVPVNKWSVHQWCVQHYLFYCHLCTTHLLITEVRKITSWLNLLAVAVLLAVLQKHLEIELRMGLIQILDHLQWIAEELMKMQQCLTQSSPDQDCKLWKELMQRLTCTHAHIL